MSKAVAVWWNTKSSGDSEVDTGLYLNKIFPKVKALLKIKFSDWVNVLHDFFEKAEQEMFKQNQEAVSIISCFFID